MTTMNELDRRLLMDRSVPGRAAVTIAAVRCAGAAAARPKPAA